MMTRAYPEIYLSNARSALGDAFDYSVNACRIPGPDFVKLFSASSVSKRMENGEPAIVAGKSGIEIAAEIMLETTDKAPDVKPSENFIRSREYWVGWAVAYYQWFSTRSYSEIFQAVPYQDLENMYDMLHEADITKFVDIMDEKIHDYFRETNLKRIRFSCGCSQAELAKRTGIPTHTIQMYEERKRDINKAQAATLYCISRVLGCSVENLIEK